MLDKAQGKKEEKRKKKMLALGLKMKENSSRLDKAQGLKKESNKAKSGLEKEIKQLEAESSRPKKREKENRGSSSKRKESSSGLRAQGLRRLRA